MSTDGEYRVVHAWAEQERLWTNTAMVRELLQALEQDRLNNGSVLSRAQIISEEFLACSRDREKLLDRVAGELIQDVWSHALESRLIPLELPQVERCEDCGLPGIKVSVSMRCVDAPKQKES